VAKLASSKSSSSLIILAFALLGSILTCLLAFTLAGQEIAALTFFTATSIFIFLTSATHLIIFLKLGKG
jgi:hypothetical protein